MQVGEGDEVCFVVGGDGEYGVSNLLDVDCPRKGGFLRIVSLRIYSMLLVRDMVGGDRRVVTSSVVRDYSSSMCNGHEPDLLRYELCCTSFILPLSKEQFAQERVQRLLLISELLTSTGILLLQRAQEPLQHQQCPFLWILLLRRGDKNARMLCPVRRELYQRGRR